MATFLAEVELLFECESQEAAGAALRRLSEAAQSAGFDLKRGRVVPAPPEDDSEGTSYVPLIEPDG
ncbi:MAG TPA: hypothetical protein VFN93_05530 [Gaiellaceae bacterium]|nr:hypothetical protein [Gaiellaceae bacterium]